MHERQAAALGDEFRVPWSGVVESQQPLRVFASARGAKGKGAHFRRLSAPALRLRRTTTALFAPLFLRLRADESARLAGDLSKAERCVWLPQHQGGPACHSFPKAGLRAAQLSPLLALAPYSFRR